MSHDLPVLPMSEVETAYYLRMAAADKPGVLADITRILGDAQISIEAFIQKESPDGVTCVPLVLLTHKVREAQMDAAIAKIEALDSIEGHITRMRVEYLDA